MVGRLRDDQGRSHRRCRPRHHESRHGYLDYACDPRCTGKRRASSARATERKLSEQQTLAYCAELRALLDQATKSLDTTMAKFDLMYSDWRVSPTPVEFSRELEAALFRSQTLKLRLLIRLEETSDVYRNYHNSLVSIQESAFKMAQSAPVQGVGVEVDSLRERALDDQDAFLDSARQLLNL
jgi:hypothetical protein